MSDPDDGLPAGWPADDPIPSARPARRGTWGVWADDEETRRAATTFPMTDDTWFHADPTARRQPVPQDRPAMQLAQRLRQSQRRNVQYTSERLAQPRRRMPIWEQAQMRAVARERSWRKPVAVCLLVFVLAGCAIGGIRVWQGYEQTQAAQAAQKQEAMAAGRWDTAHDTAVNLLRTVGNSPVAATPPVSGPFNELEKLVDVPAPAGAARETTAAGRLATVSDRLRTAWNQAMREEATAASSQLQPLLASARQALNGASESPAATRLQTLVGEYEASSVPATTPGIRAAQAAITEIRSLTAQVNQLKTQAAQAAQQAQAQAQPQAQARKLAAPQQQTQPQPSTPRQAAPRQTSGANRGGMTL
ncbi:MAG: hypothetical protein IIT36_00435 [Aeriscardovia sp.]|nr:hypothetical protein [Aeriscardovia sp.]